jgi:hypothetical protein
MADNLSVIMRLAARPAMPEKEATCQVVVGVAVSVAKIRRDVGA